MDVRHESKQDLTKSLRDRYWRADKAEKGRILDTFCAATGYHRKYAMTVLRWGTTRRGPRSRGPGRPRTYNPLVIGALRTVAEATDWICGKRMAPVLPELVAALEREGALRLSAETREALVGLSAATIDRRLAADKRSQRKGRGITKPGNLLKRQIAVRTFTPWDEQKAGFTEVDLVGHCGETTAGTYVCSLTLTDLATAWTELAAVANKGQEAAFGGLQHTRSRLPFPLLGIDSDNGTEFINHHLVEYCRKETLTFTRCRPYHKDDQAHVEQKNGNIVRHWVGYERLEGEAICAQLNVVYDLLHVYVNGYLPVRKCIEKRRSGAKVTKRYDRAATPFTRALRARVVPPEKEAEFRSLLDASGPMALKRRIDLELDRLWDLYEARRLREHASA
jgi:hypothetical protein